MSFGGIYFTNRGRALQAKALAGAQLNFTRLAVGDGSLGGQAIADLTNLINTVKSIPIIKMKVLPGGKAVVGGILSNQDIQTGFYWRELGLFAADPDLGEILYCYGNAGQLAEYIPSPGGAEILEKHVDIVTVVGNAQNVSATIEQSLLFATPQEVQIVQGNLDGHLADYVRNPGYAVTTGSNNNYLASTTPPPQGYVDGMGLVLRIHQANTGAPTINWNGLGAKPIVDSKGNALAAGKLPAGSRVSLRYSSSAGNFQLLGEGGEYGNATPDMVLEGATFGTENGLQEGTIPIIGPGSIQTIELNNHNQEYTIAYGLHSGLRKIKAVISGLMASVIRAGITVGGILGTFTSDATATAARILSGFSAYVNGVKIDGSMANRTGNVDAQSISRSGTTLRLQPQEGYYPGVSGNNVQHTDANWIEANIRQGISLFDKTGTLKPSEFVNMPTSLGVANQLMSVDEDCNTYWGSKWVVDHYEVRNKSGVLLRVVSISAGETHRFLGCGKFGYTKNKSGANHIVQHYLEDGTFVREFTKGVTDNSDPYLFNGNGYVAMTGSSPRRISRWNTSGTLLGSADLTSNIDYFLNSENHVVFSAQVGVVQSVRPNNALISITYPSTVVRWVDYQNYKA